MCVMHEEAPHGQARIGSTGVRVRPLGVTSRPSMAASVHDPMLSLRGSIRTEGVYGACVVPSVGASTVLDRRLGRSARRRGQCHAESEYPIARVHDRVVVPVKDDRGPPDHSAGGMGSARCVSSAVA